MTDHEHERRVGLGRVVEDHLSPDAPAGTPEEAPADQRPAPDPERDVADASAQSSRPAIHRRSCRTRRHRASRAPDLATSSRMATHQASPDPISRRSSA